MTRRRSTTARGLRWGLALAVLVAVTGCDASPIPSGPAQTVTVRSASPPAPSATPLRSPQTSPAANPISALFGPLPGAVEDAATGERLQAVIDAAVARGAPDIMAAVITPRGAWSGAAGVGGADRRPAAAGDAYYVGAISQIFTAATTLRLSEQGRIDLDAPLAGYLGDLVVDTNDATVRQALAHQSGLSDFPDDTAAVIGADPGRRWTPEEVVGHMVAPSSRPGDQYQLAGPNYTLLAAAAQTATGTSFAKAMRGTILDPVGATRIVQQGEDEATPMPWALPVAEQAGAFDLEDYGAGGVISCISSVSFSRGYGAVAADAPSLAAWIWHLFAGDVVDEASLRFMLPGSDGHGFGLDRLPGIDDVIGQIGSKPEYSAILAIWPAEQTVAVVFVNDLEFKIDPVAVELRDVATGD